MKNFLNIMERRYEKLINFQIKDHLEILRDIMGHCTLCLEHEEGACARKELQNIYTKAKQAYDKIQECIDEK